MTPAFYLLQRKAKGQELLDRVCDALNLVEKDYFGLTFEDRHDPRNWVELDRRLSKVLKSKSARLRRNVCGVCGGMPGEDPRSQCQVVQGSSG